MEDFDIISSVRYDAALVEIAGNPRFSHAGYNFDHTSPWYMLDLHRDRLLRAASHWRWQPVVELLSGNEGLAELARLADAFVGPLQATPFRVTIHVSHDGSIRFERNNTHSTSMENLFPRRLPAPGASSASGEPDLTADPYSLVVDDGFVQRSEYTHFKTTKRDMYNMARQRAGLAHADKSDVLLVNESDKTILECSITTPYFWRSGRWVTPSVSADFSMSEGSGGQDGTSRRWALERNIAVEETININTLAHGEECWISNGARGFLPARVELNKGKS